MVSARTHKMATQKVFNHDVVSCNAACPFLSSGWGEPLNWQMRQPGVIRPVFLEERKVMLSYVMLHCWGRTAGVFSAFLLKCHDAWFSLARFSLAMSGLCSSAPCGGGAMWGWLALLLFPSTVTMTLFWCKVISRENSGLNRNTCGKWKTWQDMAGRATSESDPQRCSGFRYCFVFWTLVWRWFWRSRLVQQLRNYSHVVDAAFHIIGWGLCIHFTAGWSPEVNPACLQQLQH